MTNAATIPAGYRQDAVGRLVPEAIIPDADLMRDELVQRLAARVERVAAELARTKRSLLDQISEHIALVASEYDVSISGASGNVVLTSFDGLRKIERSSADRVTVGEEVHAAEALIRQIVDEIDDPTARAIVDRAFRRNPKSGELNHARLIDLAAVDIDDERWRQAVRAIKDALEVQGSVIYFRAYRRDDPAQPWQQIPLDFSRIEPEADEQP